MGKTNDGTFSWLARGCAMGWQLARGVRAIKRLPGPIITIFGGKRAHRDSAYAQQAYDCAKALAERGCSIITGGGPGVMEAAHCGALEVLGGDQRTLGIGVTGVDIGFGSPCKYPMVMTDYFLIRKYLLTMFSKGFIIFPGGYGTADELFEILNLIKLQRLEPWPVILVGHDYWHNLLHWTDTALQEGLIREQDRRALILVNTVDEAVQKLHEEVLGKGCSID